MARWLSTIFLLLVLAFAAILVVPSFIDWTQFRSLIEAQASRATGRQVSIRGDISLNLLPAPAFELGDVTMADPTDSKAPLLSAETIETVAAWGPLLKGEIEIRRLRLVEPIVRLVVLEDGRTNWQTQSALATNSQGAVSGFAPIAANGKFLLWSLDKISFTDITVERGFLTYADQRNGAKDEVSDITGRFAFENMAGPGNGDVKFSIAGQPIRLQSYLGKMADGAATPVNFVFLFDKAPAELMIDGKARGLLAARRDWSAAPLGFDGTMDLKAVKAGPFADGLRALMSFGSGAGSLEPLLPGAAADLPLQATGGLALQPSPQGRWSVSDLKLTYGQSMWSGELVHDWSQNKCSGVLHTDLVYLDDFKLNEPAASNISRAARGFVLPGAAGPLQTVSQIKCDGTVAVTASNLLSDGIKLSGLEVKFDFSAVEENSLSTAITLPGETGLALLHYL